MDRTETQLYDFNAALRSHTSTLPPAYKGKLSGFYSDVKENDKRKDNIYSDLVEFLHHHDKPIRWNELETFLKKYRLWNEIPLIQQVTNSNTDTDDANEYIVIKTALHVFFAISLSLTEGDIAVELATVYLSTLQEWKNLGHKVKVFIEYKVIEFMLQEPTPPLITIKNEIQKLNDKFSANTDAPPPQAILATPYSQCPTAAPPYYGQTIEPPASPDKSK